MGWFNEPGYGNDQIGIGDTVVCCNFFEELARGIQAKIDQSRYYRMDVCAGLNTWLFFVFPLLCKLRSLDVPLEKFHIYHVDIDPRISEGILDFKHALQSCQMDEAFRLNPDFRTIHEKIFKTPYPYANKPAIQELIKEVLS